MGLIKYYTKLLCIIEFKRTRFNTTPFTLLETMTHFITKFIDNLLFLKILLKCVKKIINKYIMSMFSATLQCNNVIMKLAIVVLNEFH